MKQVMMMLVGLFCLTFLVACGGGSSDSGGSSDVTTPGDMLPDNFVGVYAGTLTLTVSAAGISQSDSFAITITVNADGTVRFDGDDPDETFTAPISNAGAFGGSLNIEEDECTGSISVSGSVDGSNASGTVSGTGQCTEGGLTVDVELSGELSAVKG